MGQFHLKQKRTVFSPLLALLFCFIPWVLPAAVIDRNNSQFYINEYGTIDPVRNPAVEQAYIVFKRLIAASSRNQGKKYKLIVLPRLAADWENWAMSLPDGTVILVENLIDLCFEQSPQPNEKGKARLAFILAHELSHLIDQHHSYLTHGSPLPFQDQGQIAEGRKLIEAKADYSGLILMTLAEYEPRFLIDQSNFFQEYIRTVRSNFQHEDHFTPQKRMVALKDNLQPLIDELPLYANGVRFYQQQEYDKAIESFQQFATYFPGREVYNNIGLSYYQLALQDLALLDSKNLYRFMLATAVDTQTLAINLAPGKNLGAPRGLKDKFEKYLEKAESNLNLAIQKDSDYLPAKINLSSVLITSQKSEAALELLQEILNKSPAQTEALNNKAVALYLSSPQSNSQAALAILEMIAEDRLQHTYRFSRYNSARIRSEQLQCYSPGEIPQNEDCLLLARKSWSPFLSVASDTQYAQRVKMELGYVKPAEERVSEKKRIALVVGNSSYATSPLLNPVNDATSIKRKLEQVGFEVLLGLDLTRFELLNLIDRFGTGLTPDSTGLVYYSGHGLQVQGENFLLPIGIETSTIAGLESVSEKGEAIRNQAVSLNVILDKLAAAKNVQNIIILDACRNNPLPGLESQFQGFAEMNAPPRTYLAYSTSPGKIAWDGLDGDYGVFTRSLLNHIQQPNLDIHELFQEVRKEVAEKTASYQTTWDVSTLDEAYYFNPPKPQDWTWHIAAGSIALLAAWQSRDEAKKYRELNSENELLIQKYGSSINLAEYIDIREQFYVNQEKMKTHKQNYQVLDALTLAAVIWEVYLLAFETYDEGIYDTTDNSLLPKVVWRPAPQLNTYGLSLQWRW